MTCLTYQDVPRMSETSLPVCAAKLIRKPRVRKLGKKAGELIIAYAKKIYF